MIETIETGSLGNLVPVATISVPTQVFKNSGVEFKRDTDDLDAYEIAAFKLNDRKFALFHYLHSPVAETELMVDRDISGPNEFIFVIRSISERFKIPVSLFYWQVSGDRASLSG